MNNSIRRSLSAKLGFTILLLAIPIFIASLGIMFLQSRRLVRHTAMDRAVSALNATMQRVELHLSVVETSTSSNSWMATTYLTPDSLMAISRSIVTLNPHTSGCSIATEPDLFPQYGRHFSVCSVRQGDTVITVREAPYEYFQNSWYKIPKTQGKACWIDPSDGIREGALNRKDTIVSYCKPLYRDGRFIGVISTDLSLRMLNEIVVREHPYPNSYFIMAGADGHVFIHPDTTQLFTNTLFSDIENSQQKDIVVLGREMTAGNKGTMLINIDGASCLVCYQPVPGTPWSLALISPESDILKGYYILANILVPLIFVGLLLITFAVLAYRNFVSHCNDVIRQIGSYDGKPQSKSPRTFLLFLVSMIAVFGIGILLVHFALRPTIYARAENDFTSEGKLEIWEIYADTIVSTNDVTAMMESWQNGDSIVVKKEVNQSDEGNQQSSRLFALKKSTSQGPAISSAVMGGKPIIQRVEVSVSYRNADNYVPIIVHLTPDASRLWSQFTREIEGRYAALVIDGVVVLEWYIQCEINNGQFFIMHKWSSDDELDEYCKKLLRQ